MKIVTLPVSILRRLALGLALMATLGVGSVVTKSVSAPAQAPTIAAAATQPILVADDGVETHGTKGGKGRTVSFS